MSNCNPTIPLCPFRGATFNEVFQWAVEPLIYKTISAVPALTPLTLTATAHGVPSGWSVALTDFDCAVNAQNWPPNLRSDFYRATAIDANTLVLNDVDGARSQITETTGTLAYLTPVDLTGGSAVFNIYPYPSTTTSPTPLLGITATLDNTAKTISISISAVQTATLTSTEYSYALIYTDASANVTILSTGTLEPQTIGVLP